MRWERTGEGGFLVRGLIKRGERERKETLGEGKGKREGGRD